MNKTKTSFTATKYRTDLMYILYLLYINDSKDWLERWLKVKQYVANNKT